MSRNKPPRNTRAKSQPTGGQKSAPEAAASAETAESPPAAAVSESKTTTARKIPGRSIFHGGLESTLDTTALLLMQAAGLAAVATLIIAGVAGVLPALLQVTAAWLVRLILRVLAEHLRLQKKAQGLPYDGQISAPKEEVTYTCSECGAMLHSSTRCDACGRAIEAEDAGS